MHNTVVAYYRTSSVTNVGEDKDSLTRQRAAVEAYATKHDLTIVQDYYDAAVRGGDPVDSRPGFAEMIGYMSGNGARTILVESAARFSRDLIVQETGFQFLKKLGFILIPVDDPDSFTEDTPTQVLIRQILGAVSQFEKASLVAKLAGARLRKRNATGRCEGRKQAPEQARILAQNLRREGLSLRAIGDRLDVAGFTVKSGMTYGPESVRRMLIG